MPALLRLEPTLGNSARVIAPAPLPKLPADADKAALEALLERAPAHFEARERLADLLTESGEFAAACQLRFEGAQLLVDLFDDESDDLPTLEWDDPYTASALMNLHASAVDHFVTGDFEMAAAMLELLLDCDPEDHLSATETLIFCYIVLEEWELWEELLENLPAESLIRQLAAEWGAARRENRSPVLSATLRETLALADHPLTRHTQHLWELFPLPPM